MANLIWQKVKENIRLGKEGYFRGIPMGLPKLSDQLCNIQKGRYDLVGGAPGTGKSAFVDLAYVMSPLNQIVKPQVDFDTGEIIPPFYDLEIVYFSLEIAPERKVAKLIASAIYEEKKIFSSYNEIYSMGNKNINPQIEKYIDEYEDYFDSLINKRLFFHTSASPDYMYKVLMDYYEARGKLTWKNSGQKDENGDDTKVLEKYVPNNPKLITIVVIDHLGLLTGNKGDKGQKSIIDRASRMLVFFRNNFGLSPVVISQFNRSIEGMDRRREDALEPLLSDFKESGNTQEDADSVIALFYPFKYSMEDHHGYPILGPRGIESNYRSAHILKNRDGGDNLMVPLFFEGGTGFFKELPTIKQIESNPKIWEKILARRPIYT